MTDARIEYPRKWIHIGSSVFALLFAWLNTWQAALFALGALFFNWQILPRIGGKSIYRPQELARGYSPGILLYPFSILLLVVLFPQDLYVTASAWGIMAWGDGFAAVMGHAFGKTKIPWNPGRSWIGTVAFFIFGSLAAIFFGWWVRVPSPEPFFWHVITIPMIAAFLSALIETIPTKLNDNFTVSLSSGAIIFALNHFTL